ncbi:MAG: UDP-glucose 4-epimerase [Bacteroidota bacterium]|jgi:nucleoside-diphosphate-sugar epimerase
MKVLVTGGAGYKGISLVKKLLEKGHHVTLLDNFMYGYEPVLQIINNPKLDVIQQDVRNISNSSIKGQDVIFHLAGISGMPACASNPDSAENINVIATQKLVSLLDKNQLLINASTTSFYGASGEECDETVEAQPVSIYGRTKLAAEKIVSNRENSISLRFATVFGVGARMRNDLLANDFAYKAIHDRSIVIFAGYSKRTFVHIDDAINAYLFALDNADIMKNNVYNVGDESLNFSKNDIADIIKKYVDFEIVNSNLPDLDVRSFLVSFKKIKELGYKTNLTLEDGIIDLIKLYKFYKVHSHFNII